MCSGVVKDHKRRGLEGEGSGGRSSGGRSSMEGQVDGESGSRWSAIGLEKVEVLGKVGQVSSEVPYRIQRAAATGSLK